MKYLLEGQETLRLDFRLLAKSDFDEWMALFKIQNVALFLGMDVNLSEEQLCQSWFDKVFHRYENDLGGMNVLVDKSTHKMVGQCGLLIQNVESEERLEIGYSILPEYWGQGFAFEASQKCKEHAFEYDFSESLISIVHVNNIASEKVALKNGMRPERYIEDFQGMPIHMFEITKEQWMESR